VSHERCDCLVVGGGPAGSALAVLLAERGLSVVLVDHGRAHYSGPNETLLASSLPMLERTGLAALLHACALPDPLRHGSIWGSDTLQWRERGEVGLWLRRGPFDAALRAAAAARGVWVVEPARVALDARGGACELKHPGGQRERVAPAFVAVATGRASSALVAAQSEASGPRTFACTLVGEPDDADRGTAVVEAVPEGWIWTHAPAQGPASAAVLLDAEQLHEQGRAQLLARAFAAARGPAGRMRAMRLVHANDATARCRTTSADVLLLGDAAATIDPLASQGVEKALAAADHAAAVLCTAVRRSDWWPSLRALHAQWERGLFAAHRAMAAAFLQRETRFHDCPFWRRRRFEATSAEATPSSTAWRTAATAAIGAVLARQGAEFTEVEGARDTVSGDSLSHIGHVPVVPLLRVFAVPRSVGEGTALAGKDPRLFVLPPRAVHEAILELCRRGWLLPAAAAAAATERP